MYQYRKEIIENIVGSETETIEFLSRLERSLLPLEPILPTGFRSKHIDNKTVIKGLYEFLTSTIMIKAEINHSKDNFNDVSHALIEIDFRVMRKQSEQNSEIVRVIERYGFKLYNREEPRYC